MKNLRFSRKKTSIFFSNITFNIGSTYDFFNNKIFINLSLLYVSCNDLQDYTVTLYTTLYFP